MNAGIIGVGKYIPEKILANLDLEKILETSDEWIRTRTGIKERRIAEEVTTTEMAYEAGKSAIENAGLKASDIDMILVATVTPETSFPTTSCRIQEKLGAVKAAAMDISAACSGFIYGLVTASQFVNTNTYKNILVIGVEKLSKITDWDDRNTAVLFGDGAGAAVVSSVSDGRGLLSFELGSDGNGAGLLYSDEKQLLRMAGNEVFKFAVRQMGDSSINVLHKAGLDKKDVDLLIPHQANIRIIESSRERMGLPVEKVMYTIEKYGNTSSSSIPIALCEAVETGRVKEGDNIVMVGFGAGLTWGAVCLNWGR